jgi:hypothetical protein
MAGWWYTFRMQRPSAPTITGIVIGFVLTVVTLNTGNYGASLIDEPAAASSSISEVPPPPREIFMPLERNTLLNMEYTLGTDYVRQRLLQAGLPFSVTLHDGAAEYGGDALRAKPFTRVEALSDFIVFGDMDGDGSEDAVIALKLSGPDGDIIELELVRNSRGEPLQAGSHPLAVLQVDSLTASNGSIMAKVQYVLPGEPAEFVRQSDVVLTLPPLKSE